MPPGQQVSGRMQHLVGSPQTLALRRAGPIDVRPGPRMCPVNEQDTRPEMNRLFEVPPEVLVEPLDEERLSAALTLGRIRRAGQLAMSRFTHGVDTRDYIGPRRRVQRRTAPAPSSAVGLG
jgi:hypothetical protein